MAIWLALLGWACAVQWHTFTDTRGRQVVAEVKAVHGDTAEVRLKKNFRISTLKFSQLSDADQEYLRSWNKAGAETSATAGENAVDRFRSRSKSAIRSKIREIKARKPGNGISRDQQKAVNSLNIYRYLCGLDYDVKAYGKWVVRAQEAAETCEKNARIAHDLGGYTDACNLSVGKPSMESTVEQYIADMGANNRDARGHRMWCLHPQLGRTGFGIKGSYSAMYVKDDTGGKAPRKGWCYPGRGYFPLDFLHHNAWSYYSSEELPASLQVEVFKIRKTPEKPYSKNEEIPGERLPVPFTKVMGTWVNFEPLQETVGRGTYWVRLKAPGFHAGYLVDLF